ncbi:unnamed protein product [Rhizophagus irregularis]|nr:unnamed protein product [Rhizophagus irregularis]
MTYHFETEVTKALEQLLKTETDYNVIIYAEKKHDSKKFHDHSNILQFFDVILKYLYADYIDITDKIGTGLLNIIIASDELNLENLTRFTKGYIVEHRQLLQNDPVGALQTVFYCESLINLRDLCLETICIEPENLINSLNYPVNYWKSF